MGDRRDISCPPSLRTHLQEAPVANVVSKVTRRGKEKDFTFSFEESVGWTNFLYSTLEPLV